MGRLTARKVETAKPGVHLDGQGLRLIVGATGSRKWVFRFMRRGRSQEMGLGGADVSLAMARERAADARRMLAAGQNPIEAARLAKTGRQTFGKSRMNSLSAKQSEWRNAKHRAQWEMTLQEYCAPLRSRPVDEIDTAAVLEVLKPLWASIPETASRIRGRIEVVLDAARARGLIGPHEAKGLRIVSPFRNIGEPPSSNAQIGCPLWRAIGQDLLRERPSAYGKSSLPTSLILFVALTFLFVFAESCACKRMISSWDKSSIAIDFSACPISASINASLYCSIRRYSNSASASCSAGLGASRKHPYLRWHSPAR